MAIPGTTPAPDIAITPPAIIMPWPAISPGAYRACAAAVSRVAWYWIAACAAVP